MKEKTTKNIEKLFNVKFEALDKRLEDIIALFSGYKYKGTTKQNA